MKGPFFYQHQDRQVGPLTVAELKQHAATGQLLPDDRVWTDDKPAGTRALEIKGLFPSAPPRQAPADDPRFPPAPVIQPPPLPGELERKVSPSPAAADGTAKTSARIVAVLRTIARKVGAEVLVTSQVCAAQVGRLVSFLRTRFASRSAEKQALSALIDFGQKLDAAGQGEPALRSQVEQLSERRRSVEAAKASPKQVDIELRGLLIRLATPVLESPTPPAGLEKEHQAARSAQESSVTAQARHREQQLFPKDRASILRVIGGGCVAILALWVMARWFVFSDPGPPGATKQEVWWDENDTFPRRLAVGKFVGDVPWGEIKMYDEERRLIAAFPYKEGELHGTATMYYPNGKKFHQGKFVNGKREGTHYIWFDSGKLAQTLECRNGVPHGEQIMYYDNGAKFAEGKNVEGKAEGELKGYLPDGRLVSITVRSKGEIVSEKQQVETTSEEQEIVNKRASFPVSAKAHWSPGSSDSSSIVGDSSSPGLPGLTLPPSGGGGGGGAGSQKGICFNCNGLGQANCMQCFGSGKRTCFNCNGRGRAVNNMQCFQCNGTGQQNCSFCQYGKVQCPQCFGSGRK